MRHVHNAHGGGAANQASEDGALLQEHGDDYKTERCGGRESVCGDGIQPDREVGIGYN